MEKGATRGIEKVTRNIRKRLIIRRTIDFTIAIIFNVFGAYFMRTNNMVPQVICQIIPLGINAFSVFGYNICVLQMTGKSLIKILQKVVDVRKNKYLRKQSTIEAETPRVEVSVKRFEILLPVLSLILGGGSVVMITLVVWGVKTIDGHGMSGVSIALVVLELFLMLPAFIIGAYLFNVY